MSAERRHTASNGAFRGLVLVAQVSLLAVIFVFMAVSARAQANRAGVQRAEGVELVLDVGEQHVMPTEGVRSYSEGTPGIVEVRLTRDARQFVIVGQKVGVTSLLLILADGSERQIKITVRDPSPRLPALDAPSTSIAPKDNIRLDLYFVELRASARSQFGLGWPAAVGGGTFAATFDVLSGSTQSATASITDQALPRLDLARATGWAKISRQAAVVTANGTEAAFSGGGEVNIPVRGALAAEIRSIEFGSTVRVLPRYDHETGRIELSLHAEVSDLTEDTGTGAPGRAKANVQTVVNLQLGQALVLGGLTARSEAHGRVGIPLLSEIPIFGILFGTVGHRKDDSESIVLIVPTVVSSMPSSSKERVREAMQLYRGYEGERSNRALDKGLEH